tara:strand:- start:143 stop:331 length:189 start_codon:yes stop_codon:yes gene_type:complete
MQNIWRYGEIHKARVHDNGDRVDYGHGPAKSIREIIINGETIRVVCIIGRSSKRKGAKQYCK